MNPLQHPLHWMADPTVDPAIRPMRPHGAEPAAPRPCADVDASVIEQAWRQVRADPDPALRQRLREQLREGLRARQAVMVAHYYVHPDLQDLAEETGGMVGDSLEMARFGRQHPAQTLLVCGVRFMGETAKILSPHKRVLMPQLTATCSLDLGCPIDAFEDFCDAYPERTVVVYANTSAAVKARADWMVTSGSAVAVVRFLHAQGHKILWAPDRHLGAYVQRETGADLLCWPGSCSVHDEFKAQALRDMKRQWPQARVLVHPESPLAVIDQADTVGSTSAILLAAAEPGVSTFIVATDAGLLHQLRRRHPDKTFLLAPTEGESATCKSCAHCPWMAQNHLHDACLALLSGGPEVVVPVSHIIAAQQSIHRLMAFTARQVPPAPAFQGWVPDLGAA